MPIYAYRCDDCGHAQDFLQKMSDPLIAACPQCGSKNFAKQLSAPQFQLKGGGWYVTDFRDNGKKDGKDGKKAEGGAASGDAATGADAKAGEAKVDTKSETKSDSASAPAATPTPAATPAAASSSDTKAA
jgi:putative FmdB family regulatory protein